MCYTFIVPMCGLWSLFIISFINMFSHHKLGACNLLGIDINFFQGFF